MRTLLIVQSIAILLLCVVVAGLLYYVVTMSHASPNTTANKSPVAGSPTRGTNPTATVAPPKAFTYSAALPGPGCDKSGGAWTPQGIDGISCPSNAGTELVINASGARGYLYLQLPGNKAFSANNKISVTGTLGETASGYQTKCVGLAELDATGGYSVEYCNTGQWFIYSISSGGTILQTLEKNVANALTAEEISLTIQGTSLSFSLANAVAGTITISALQPTQVAIVYDCVGYGANSTIGGNGMLVNGFSYMELSS
jgi:hypothetical protein